MIDVDETVDFARVMFELTTSMVRGTPKWGERAHAALFTHGVNGLFYMMPEQLSAEEMKDDWKLKLMNGNIDIMHEHPTAIVPIIAVHGEESPYSPI